MAALTDLSDVINRLTGGNSGTPEHIFQFVDARTGSTAVTAPVAARWSSLYRYNKAPKGFPSIPGAAAVPVNTDDGALGQTDPGGARQKWLLGVAGCFTQPGNFLLYDRLLHNGGLSGTVTTAQTVGGTLTRYTGGVGNLIAVEIYTTIGTTATTITASYTNQANTSGRTTQAVTFGGTGWREDTRMIILPLQTGDTGVRSVQSVTVLATTGTAGSFGVTIIHPLATLPQTGIATGFQRDFLRNYPTVEEIFTDACLCYAYYCSTTTGIQGVVEASFVEK